MLIFQIAGFKDPSSENPDLYRLAGIVHKLMEGSNEFYGTNPAMMQHALEKIGEGMKKAGMNEAQREKFLDHLLSKVPGGDPFSKFENLKNSVASAPSFDSGRSPLFAAIHEQLEKKALPAPNKQEPMVQR